MKTYICNRIKRTFLKRLGELPEWLMEQFAKLSTGNCRVGSNPTLSAKLTIVSIPKLELGYRLL